MELRELTDYARETYQLEEQHKWAEFPGFSVLCHPQTGKWVALLMRQWDSETGTEIQRCDLKCGGGPLIRMGRPYLSPPIRMRGGQWTGVAFDESTERETVLRLFDQAIAAGRPHGFTIVLDSRPPEKEESFRDTALPFAGSAVPPPREALPERLREMRRMYEYAGSSPGVRARNFYRQAAFMEDYEDDFPWEGEFVHYFPTYHDLTTRQLRGYFTWRARLRRGEAQPIPASAAYLYVYELLNGVGAEGPEQCFQKLREFETLFLDSGIGEASIRPNLRRWMLEYAVLWDLPPSLAREAVEAETLERDEALEALRDPESHGDAELFAALHTLGGKKLESSPVLLREGGEALFARVWRAAAGYSWQGKDLFTLCFGEKVIRRWYPLSNAVYYERSRPRDREYVLDPCRSYRCYGGLWTTAGYEKLAFDRPRLQGFLHETDARLRRYLKTGRYLRECPADEWAVPYIESVIRAEEQERMEAARPRVHIDLSGLAQIRADAASTRESLLTEAEREAPEDEAPETAPVPAAEDFGPGDLPLEPMQTQVLLALLEGRDPGEIMRARHAMPSIVADGINEALFDVLGDTVVLCEDERLLLVDDYIKDLREILGGTEHGGA